jgi:uncharacterized protein (TIGR02594 family)
MGKPFTGIDAWLNTAEGLPLELQEAIKHNGLLETKGKGNTVNIMRWATILGVIGWYASDLVPWCGLFKGICAFRAGKLKLPAPMLLSAAWWRKWGVKIEVNDACVGDTLIKNRDGGAHVTYCIGENSTHFRCYGGNQSDSVCPTWIPKSDFTDCRRADFKVKPEGVKKHIYADHKPTGIKIKEA